MSNPSVGRHNIGAPIAKSGTKPKSRTGSSSGSPFGAGVNRKTVASPQHTASPSSSSQNYKAQGEQFVKQSPEPFRNPAFGAKPTIPATSQSGDSGPYQTFKGSRISVSDGDTTALGGKPSAVGIKGAGMGSENGKVAGLKQPRRAGSPHTQGGMAQKKATKPSFYGR